MKRTLIAAALASAFALPATASEPVIHFDREAIERDVVIALEDARRGAAEGKRASEAALQHAERMKAWSEDFRRDMQASMGPLFAERVGSGRTVKGAPYSAEVVTETNQALADGNVISKRTTSRVFRDAEGRTRQELSEGRTPSVFISDPVAHKHVILKPSEKSAVVTEQRERHFVNRDEKRVKVDGTDIRIENGKVFVDGKEVAGNSHEVKTKGGKAIVVQGDKITVDGKDIPVSGRGEHPRVVVKRIDGPDGLAREEVRVQVVRRGESKDIVVPVPPVPPVPPLPPLPPMAGVPMVLPFDSHFPGAHTFRFESTAKLGKGVTKDLGQKDFDGVRAEGKSTTWTIPAGEIGNRAPIHIVSETWHSPDLQVTVYSKHSDPRRGETIYRLAGIKRGEPSSDLFKVPEGYETKARGRS